MYEYALEVRTALRVNNNKLRCLEGLGPAVVPLLTFCGLEQLLWLDVSFNDLRELDLDHLSGCPNLTVLHLHKNRLGETELLVQQAKARARMEAKASQKAGQRVKPKAANDLAQDIKDMEATKAALWVRQPWLPAIDSLRGFKRLQNLSLFANPGPGRPGAVKRS